MRGVNAPCIGQNEFLVTGAATQGDSCMDLPILSPDYRPSDDETYMSPTQLAYFRQKLAQWKAELLNESEDTLAALQEQSRSTPEAVERASMESAHALDLTWLQEERPGLVLTQETCPVCDAAAGSVHAALDAAGLGSFLRKAFDATLSRAELDAIDYFNTHGGGGVSQGGIVVFAAGNDDSSASSGTDASSIPSVSDDRRCCANSL